MNPRHAWAHHVLGLALLAKEQFAEAIAEFEKSQRGPSGNLGHAYAVAGRRSEALKVLDQLQSRYDRERIGAGNIAQVYIGLGDYDRALAWLNTEFSDGGSLATLFVAPVLDPLRNDPRFQDLLQRFRAPD
jgi:tetratricopeptide (TPR) repeat protein